MSGFLGEKGLDAEGRQVGGGGNRVESANPGISPRPLGASLFELLHDAKFDR